MNLFSSYHIGPENDTLLSYRPHIGHMDPVEGSERYFFDLLTNLECVPIIMP